MACGTGSWIVWLRRSTPNRSIGGRSLLFLIDDGDATMFKSKIAIGQIDEVHPYGVDELHTIETMGDMVTAVQSYVKQQMRGHLKK